MTEDKEKILRKTETVTTEIIERPIVFTTHRKPKIKTTINISRKGSIVKERSRQLTEIALELFPDRHVTDEDLDYLVKRYIGADKETVRSYLGYQGFVKRSKKTGEGYVQGTNRKGYLEVFGFMHRISRTEWVIHAQAKLPLAHLEPNISESCGEISSKEKISISRVEPSKQLDTGFLQGKEREKTVLEVVSPTNSLEAYDTESKINNNNITERDRNFTPKIFPKIFGEVPLRCVECGRVDVSNPYRVWCPRGKGERGRSDVCVLERGF